MKQVFALLLLGATLLSPGPGLASPQVTVRGRTALALRSVDVHSRGATFIAHLRELGPKRGIPGALLRLQLQAQDGRPLRATGRTDHRGNARFELRTRRGQYTVTLLYGGSGFYAGCRFVQRDLDLSKATVAITARFKGPLDTSRNTQRIEVSYHVGDRPTAGALSVEIDKRTIAREMLPAASKEIDLPTRALGKPGVVRLTLRFPGSAQLNPARAELRGLLVTPATLTLKADRHEVHHDGALRLDGALSDSQGPVARAAVTLEAMGHHVISVVTDARGRYGVRLAARDFPPGPLDLRASFSPSVPWRKAAKSAPLAIGILPPRPFPVRAYALSTLGTLLTLLLIWGWRRRDLFLRSRSKQDDEVAPADDEPPAAPLEGGLVRARSRHLLRQELGISGTIWDPVDQRPIVGAQVVVSLLDATVQTRSDEQGRFALHQLLSGRHAVEVSCDGYLPERFSIALPHRGPLHGMRVDLIAVRVRLLEVYREAARPRLPRTTLWGRWTPRELLQHLGEPSRSAFAELSQLLERCYWSPDPPDETVLRRAEQLWARIEGDNHALRP